MRAIVVSGAVLAMALASSLADTVSLPLEAEPLLKPYDEQPREQKGRLFHDSARHGTYRKKGAQAPFSFIRVS